MTKEEQRIAIAEFMGGEYLGDGLILWTSRQENCDNESDPLSDLNAMHEAVDRLGYEDYQLFCLILGGIVREQWNKKWIVPAERMAINATAEQKCEALLRTIGKRKETPHE